MSINYSEERLTLHDYIEFPTRTDLGLQYPKERFHARIERLLRNASTSIAARDGDKIVGICLRLTDFAYWLMITDLGVDRSYLHRGIGRNLLKMAHETAGGEIDIVMALYANSHAIPFYEKCGL